jgi:uncharacterized protein
MMRLVVDTNILLASIGTSAMYRWLFDAMLQGQCCVLVTTEIMLEYREVIGNRTRPAVADNVVQTLLNMPFIERTTVYYRWNLLSTDPDDNKFADCAVAGNADYIITKDKHFSALRNVAFPHIEVISPEDIQAIL